jgi:hypothetical protein
MVGQGFARAFFVKISLQPPLSFSWRAFVAYKITKGGASGKTGDARRKK